MRKSTFRKMRQEQKEYQLAVVEKEDTAYHEATHCVVAVLLDFPLEFASVIPYTADGLEIEGVAKIKTETGNGKKILVTNNQVWMYLMVQLAPALVESSRKTHQPDSISGGDAETINRILSAAPEDQRTSLMDTAYKNLKSMLNDKKVRQAIDRVAQMFFENCRVEGEEIRREVMAIAGHRFISRRSMEAVERQMLEGQEQPSLREGATALTSQPQGCSLEQLKEMGAPFPQDRVSVFLKECKAKVIFSVSGKNLYTVIKISSKNGSPSVSEVGEAVLESALTEGLITGSTAYAVYDGDDPELPPAPIPETAELRALRAKEGELWPSLRHGRGDDKKA